LKGRCELFSSCNPVYSNDESTVFVRNVERMSPHWLPTRKVTGAKHHFFVIGDWGSESCPGKGSMHYVFRGPKPGSEKFERDHNAQRTIANNMGKLGDQVKPFLVVNAGDNFYWGGVLPKMIGGNDIHDHASFRRGFEEVYTHPSLKVPWLTVMVTMTMVVMVAWPMFVLSLITQSRTCW